MLGDCCFRFLYVVVKGIGWDEAEVDGIGGVLVSEEGGWLVGYGVWCMVSANAKAWRVCRWIEMR